MAQHDYNIANATAPNFRTDLNNNLSAIVSQNSGTSAPSNTFANMMWYDTTNNILKMRNEADSSWINLFTLDQSANTSNPSSDKVGMEFIESQDASTSATLDFTGFDSTRYDAYVFVMSNLVASTEGSTDFHVLTSTDGGSTYDSGASAYAYVKRELELEAVPTDAFEGSAGSTFIQVAGNLGAVANESFSGELKVFGPHLTAHTRLMWTGVFNTRAKLVEVRGSASRLSAADVDAIQFLFNAGNISSGTITMYGLRNS